MGADEDPSTELGQLLDPPPAHAKWLLDAGKNLSHYTYITIIIICTAVVPRNLSHGPGPHYARHCTNTKQEDSVLPKELTI